MSSTDELEERIRVLEIDAEGEPKGLQQITTMLKFAVLIPLTIVVSNQLGSFLPLPVVCKEYNFGGVLTRWMSHILLIFLIGFSISGNIDYSIFNMPNSKYLDIVFTILAWVFLLMLLRLRHAYMYLAVGFVIFVTYILFLQYKTEYETRIENKKKSKEDQAKNENASSTENNLYYATLSLLLFMMLLVIIFYFLSVKEYIETLPNFSNSYTEPIKIKNETYFLTQKKLSDKDKLQIGFTHMFFPEVANEDVCANILSKDSKNLGLKFGTSMSASLPTVDSLKSKITDEIRCIPSYSSSMQKELLKGKILLDTAQGSLEIRNQSTFDQLF